jgi:hypothetical protein
LVLKDPYILDFLDLRDHYMERDFEDAILRELEMFLLELGAGSPSSLARNAFSSTEKTSTSTCSSITGSSSGWSLSS